MKKKYSLIGVDVNAFAVMGYVRSAMKECGFNKKDIDSYLKRAMSAGYDNLIVESINAINECNNR